MTSQQNSSKKKQPVKQKITIELTFLILLILIRQVRHLLLEVFNT